MKLFFTLFFTSLFAAMSAQTIYVKSNATGANNGTSWSNAYNSLGLALMNATSGAQIWVYICINLYFGHVPSQR